MIGIATFVVVLSSGVGGDISDWLAEGFLANKWYTRYAVTPLATTAAISLIEVFVYSTVVKAIWNWLDARSKYKRPRSGAP